MSMEISRRQAGPGLAVITVSGKVMMGPQSEGILTTVDELLRAGTRNIVFDISGLTRIDSTGIGRFIASYNRIAGAGGEMSIAGASGHMVDVFHASRLDTVFHMYPTVDAACSGA